MENTLEELGFTETEPESDVWFIVLPIGDATELHIEQDRSACVVRRHTCDGEILKGYDYVYLKELKDEADLRQLVAALQ